MSGSAVWVLRFLLEVVVLASAAALGVVAGLGLSSVTTAESSFRASTSGRSSLATLAVLLLFVTVPVSFTVASFAARSLTGRVFGAGSSSSASTMVFLTPLLITTVLRRAGFAAVAMLGGSSA